MSWDPNLRKKVNQLYENYYFSDDYPWVVFYGRQKKGKVLDSDVYLKTRLVYLNAYKFYFQFG
jgi:hypothetical protein